MGTEDKMPNWRIGREDKTLPHVSLVVSLSFPIIPFWGIPINPFCYLEATWDFQSAKMGQDLSDLLKVLSRPFKREHSSCLMIPSFGSRLF